MKACPPATDHDPRHLGWPCHGKRLPGKERANGSAMWLSMLSMRSTSSLRDQGQGDWTDQGNWPAPRSSGASPARLQAIRDDREDLQREADGNQGSHLGTVQVRADEKLGEALMASTACGETRKTSPTRKNKEDSEPATPRRTDPQARERKSRRTTL